MIPSPPIFMVDGEMLYFIYTFGFFLGTVSSTTENGARKEWINMSKMSIYWRDLRAEMVLRS